MARVKTPSSAVLAAQMQVTLEERLIRANDRLVNCEGEIPELVSQMTVPYECTVCLGKVMLEQAVVTLLNNVVGCPYCYEMRLVDDENKYGPPER